MEKSEVKFKSVEIVKGWFIGSGYYGAVHKTRCDEVLCASKTLFDCTGHFQIAPLTSYTDKYVRECEHMTMVRHPNIVQYLGLHKDQNGLAVLLMELMDDNLTQYLKNSSEAVPYHIQQACSQTSSWGGSFFFWVRWTS